ncbi:RNA polymerase sigma factor SigX [Bacillus sp. FJAT-49736]|uniref:RNA polymerase sigma factor SigX n=1 Tax=Bacillus sp. FJAT-49736 TaxID=2833582 RepID=UPI001BC8E311|nr:RNA polymerase sigma factor SigX [Bacillus sp. FJAT-49736]MBS4173317.1 RNA polymerase sigma factor SigX [Bacillus sp. FJAT-49736]
MDSVFKEIYNKYHQDLFQFLIYMVKNRDVAEDLTQEVYIRVLKSYHHFEGKSSEKTWLFSIARNVAIDHFRKQKSLKNRMMEVFDWNKNQVSDLGPLPEEIAMKNENIRLLYQCLDFCTKDQKMVIVLRYLNNLSISETAEILNWSESKVKTTQHRALAALRKWMNEKDQKGGARQYG